MLHVSVAEQVLFLLSLFFFFNDTATTEIYTLSLHDALPISIQTVQDELGERLAFLKPRNRLLEAQRLEQRTLFDMEMRSEEHTSELQSRLHLVCRLLLEKKKPGCVIFTAGVVATGAAV